MSEKPPSEDEKIRHMVGKVINSDREVELERALNSINNMYKVAKAQNCGELFYNAVMTQSTKNCCPAMDPKNEPRGPVRTKLVSILRAFRFPCVRHDVQFKSIMKCKYKYSPEKNKMCLNPWHYRWIELPRYDVQPIVVNKYQNYGRPPPRNDDAFEEHLHWQDEIMDQESTAEASEIQNVKVLGDELRAIYEHLSSEYNEENNQNLGCAVPFNGGAPMPSDWPSTSSASFFPVTNPFFQSTSSSEQQGPQDEIDPFRTGLSSPASNVPSPYPHAPNGDDKLSMREFNPVVDDFDAELESIADEAEQNSENIPREKPTYPDGRPITPIEPRPLFRSSAAEFGNLVQRAAYECVPYKENPYWLRLMYFEGKDQIGQIEQFASQHVLVDGFSSSSERTDGNHKKCRFSIGFYTNPRRSDETLKERALIGRGIRFYLLGGEVYIENLGGTPVFVQSICANLKNNFPLTSVTRIEKGGSMKVFDMRTFSKKLSSAAQKTYQDVYCLGRMCTLRVAFGKGWGQIYGNSHILNSPVWFQVHLNNPMAWIDSVLNCMGAPPRLCSSRT